MRFSTVRSKATVLIGTVVLLFCAIAGAGLYANHQIKNVMAEALEARNLETQAILAATSVRAAARQSANTFKTVLLRGTDDKLYKEALTDYRKTDGAVRDGLAKLEAIAPKIGLDLKADAQAFLKQHGEVVVKLNEGLKLYDPVNVTTAFLADQAVAGIDAPLVAAAAKLADRVRDHSQVRSAAARVAAEDIAKRWGMLIGVALAVGVLVALLVTMWMSISVLRSLGGEPQDAMAVASRIANGDLSIAVPCRAGDQASLMASMRRMQEALHNTVTHVSASGDLLARTASQLSASTAQISGATLRQSEASASMASSVERMSASIEQVSAHSGEALRMSQRSRDLSEASNQVVQAAAAEMNATAESAQGMTDIMRDLEGHSGRISKIVHVISDIANQTNLLALNAAIEAARAGEHGRGFAVVADEVRKLAERTSASTREIGGMVQAIQVGTAQAAEHMLGWSGQVAAGVARARGAGERMEEVRESAGRVVVAGDQINVALTEQTSAGTQLAHDVEGIARMSDENAACAVTMSGQAGQLASLAQTLQGIIGRFRMRPA